MRLYERRLEAPDLEANPRQRGELLMRLGQVFEERCLEVDRAIECYQDLARSQPDFRPPLIQLRRIYVAREQWDLALQVAEVEGALPMAPHQQAAFAVEMGEIWHHHLGDLDQARAHFERALEADASHVGALLGLAIVLEEQERFEEAIEHLERAVGHLAGPDRAPALVALAHLLRGQQQAERAEELYRRALTDDPRNEEALDALVESATDKEQWELVADLQERRFNLAAGAMRRLALAHEAGRLWLERLRNPQGARLWLRRALELFADDPVTHFLLADTERLAGNGEALASHLSRAVELAGAAAPPEALRECARLAKERGDLASAVEPLKILLERFPERRELVAELADVLERVDRDDELIEILERQVALSQQEPRAHAAALVQLGSALEERAADLDGAVASYERAMGIDPTSEEAAGALERLYRKSEDWNKLRAHLDSARARASGARAVDLHCAYAELLLDSFADSEGAHEALGTAAGLDPDSQRARRGLERIAVLNGDDESILEAFEREASVTSDRGRLAFLVWEMVRIREQRAEREEALLWLERLVGADPENRQALEHCARLQQQLDQGEALVETLERLDVLLEGEAQADNRRRIASLRHAHGETDQAIDDYRRALDAEPGDPKALAMLADLYEKAGRWAELAEVERERTELLPEPERAGALSQLATLLLERLDDVEGAVLLLGRLADEGTASEADEDRLARLLDDSGRYEELEERLAARRERSEGDAAAALDRRRAALLLDRLARPADAAALLAALREAAPGDRELRDRLERALREANDAGALAGLLAERAEEATSQEESAALSLERAALLETAPETRERARTLYTELEQAGGPAGVEAAERIDVLLERAGDWQPLRERLEARLAQEPDVVGAHERLAGICRDRLGDRAGATRHLEVAARAEPERPELWQSLARLYEEEQQPQDQLRALESELETGPDPERERLLHARAALLCRDVLGDADRAERHFARVHELDPADPAAAGFLLERLEAEGRHEELADLLERRLEQLGEASRESETALRLRIAALRAGPIGDVEGAIAVLEPVARRPEALPVAAEPLADLYLRGGRRDDFVALSRHAIESSTSADERASWSLRLADALREAGEDAAAAETYRQVLADRPDAREARGALRHLYRQLGENDALARLLEAELSRVGGSDEIPLRLELAELMVQALSRPGDALVHLRRVLEIEPGHGAAEERALALSEQLGRHDERLTLLDTVLAREHGAAARARRLAERGYLLAGPLARPEEAARSLRESLALDASDAGVRRQLRRVLEDLQDWEGVLDCLSREARQLDPEARGSVFDEAARLAAEHLGHDAALPWLERLRATRIDDPETLARIAEVHRRADRPVELVRALEAELELEPEDERRRELQLERADLYEKQLELPARAAEALEDALAADPQAAGVLERLTRLYTRDDRAGDLARVLEARLQGAEGRDRRNLLRELARLHAGPLGAPRSAADSLWAALGAGPEGPERAELLRSLGDAFRRAGRDDLWARAAESELAALDRGEPVFVERRCELSRELATAYDGPLALPGRALPRWRALVDEAGAAALGSAGFDAAERALLRGLRRAGEHVELARRLEQRLEREPVDAERWLELARLRAERLHRTGGAASAYREVLKLEPGCREALQGLRTVAERLGDWAEVARALELELERPEELPAPSRAALWRRLGEIAWRRLDSTTRASRAFAAALEADPRDLVALRSVQVLFETMEDWRGARDFYESEIELLDEREPERRREIWLRVGELGRDRLDDLESAARAYDSAAQIGELGELPLERRAEWADLHRRLEQPARFTEVFAPWCDAEQSPATAEDHLELARVLEELGRMEAARERLERAVEGNAKHAQAWDQLVRLRELAGDLVGCGEALEQAAACHSGDAAAERRHRAAVRIEGEDPERALGLLERAVDDDPARRSAHADLARLAEELGRHERALVAAQRVLDLAPITPGSTDADSDLAAALAGARAAHALDRAEAAEQLYAAAREVEPRHAEAIAGHAELLYERGEHEAARAAFEARLALEDEDPARARHLAQLARCVEAMGDCDAALARFEEAIELEPELELAQEGRIALLERGERRGEAVEALRGWAELAATTPERSARLLRAAEHELKREEGAAAAEELLREASADAENDRAWALLAEVLAAAGRQNEALDVATRALETLPEAAPARGALARVRAEVLEQRGDRAEAAEAYRLAARLDATRTESALAAARLLRGLGEWREAADVLRDFVNGQAGGDSAGLATALHQLGRLLAGPLENVEGAIEVYRRAVAADPSLLSVREALADLLAHRAEHHAEALGRHRELLAEDPTRTASLRGVLRIARARGDEPGESLGRTILAALGCATSEEREGALDTVVRPRAAEPRFGDPLWEAARRLLNESAAELGEALGVGAPGDGKSSGAGDPHAAFREALVTAEGRLAAPAIVPLPTDELAEVVGLLADLALEAEGVRGQGRLVNALSRQLGRRARKRLRRLLEGRGSGELARIDFAAWREELSGLAGVSALATTGVPLRTALCAWLGGEGGGDGEEAAMPGPEADLSSLLAGCPEARTLLRRLTLDWVDAVTGRAA